MGKNSKRNDRIRKERRNGETIDEAELEVLWSKFQAALAIYITTNAVSGVSEIIHTAVNLERPKQLSIFVIFILGVIAYYSLHHQSR